MTRSEKLKAYWVRKKASGSHTSKPRLIDYAVVSKRFFAGETVLALAKEYKVSAGAIYNAIKVQK